uniref:Uncharacterized protein n=1 Tax=Lepeophtheirus salmonis TaxID=72036 RepID=A0A0K2TR03_LEPSM
MEQARRDAILELVRAGHRPSTIYKLLNYPKTTVYRVFNAWEIERKVCRKAPNMRSDLVGQELWSEQAAGLQGCEWGPWVQAIPNCQRTHPHGIHEGHQAHQR